MDKIANKKIIKKLNNMNNHIKALKNSEKEIHPFIQKYYDFRFWWVDNVFYKLPQWIQHIYYDWNHFYYEQISSRIWHRNKWALKAIPRTFADFGSIVPDFFYNFIISYVDEQKYFEAIVIEEPMASKIKEIYDFARIGRSILLSKIEDAYPPLEPNWLENLNKEPRKSYKEQYGKVDKLEKELEKKDTEYMVFMTKNRNFFWT